MSFKGKWFYEACNNPKCKKSAEAGTNCLNCNHYNDSTNRRFILPIEISDFTGSLWVTAFDELAQDIFKGIPIDQLSKLSESELRD
jgi:replication factor A1